MRRRRGSDASFLVGVILGLVVGAAIAVIIAQSTQDDKLFLNTEVERAKESLESVADEAKTRIEGASEGLSKE
jgi:gas vesicle protein